jgi:stage V sporulation protein G
VIEGTKGLFVAMPSRRLKESCPKCHFKNVVRSKYCNQCGSTLPPPAEQKPAAYNDKGEKQSEHRDIAHPITTDFREYIQKKVLSAYEEESKKGSAQPSMSGAPTHKGRIDTMDEDDDIEL